MFFITKGSKFPKNRVFDMKQQMKHMSKEQLLIIDTLDYRDPNMNFLISFFAGYLGIDRFLIGDNVLGVLKLLTLGGLGIWMMIDWIFIINLTRNYNYRLFLQFAKYNSSKTTLPNS